MPTTEVKPINTVRINLPSDLYRTFSTLAASKGLELEDLLSRHLAATRDHDTDKGRGIKISPEDRQEIEKAFSRSFKDGRELTHFLNQVYAVQIGGVTVQLSAALLQRLNGRRGRMDFDAFLKETIIAQLEHFAGMR